MAAPAAIAPVLAQIEATRDEFIGFGEAGSAGLAHGPPPIGPGTGIGHLVGNAVQAMARPPPAAGLVRTTMFLGIAFTEALALIGFVVFILLKFA